MFGISWGEFLVILLIGVIVIPARLWPDVAVFMGRVVRTVRELIWRVADASENIKRQIELERPIDEMMTDVTDNVLDAFSELRPKAANKKKSKSRTKK